MRLWGRLPPRRRRARLGRFISWMKRRTDTERASPEVDGRSEAVEVVPDSLDFQPCLDDGSATAAESVGSARSSTADTRASSYSRKQTSPRTSTAAALALFSSRATTLLSVVYPESLYPVDSADPLFAVEVDHGRKNPNVVDTVLISSYFDDVRVYRQTYTSGIPRIIKRGIQVKIEEGEITHWIRSNTTIPVLRIAAYGSSSKIEFEYIEGSEELEKAWPSLDAAARATIADELVEVLKVMQEALHPADGLIASYQRVRAAALHSFNRPEWPSYTPTSSATDFFDWAR
ncbi:hypothetical protein JCM10296v2_006040 [Rhodotorula toruloides]